MTATSYIDKIIELCAKMFSIRPLIHSSNRNAIDKYLQTVWKRANTLTSSFVSTYQTEALQDRFKSYVDAEEQRLREGLETVRYDIDAMDTLSLVTGPGRIEKVRFPCYLTNSLVRLNENASTSSPFYTSSFDAISRSFDNAEPESSTRMSYGTLRTPLSGCSMLSPADTTISKVGCLTRVTIFLYLMTSSPLQAATTGRWSAIQNLGQRTCT